MNDEQKGRYATALNKLMAQAQEATFKEYEKYDGWANWFTDEAVDEARGKRDAYAKAFDIFCVIDGMPIEDAGDLTKEEFEELINGV